MCEYCDSIPLEFTFGPDGLSDPPGWSLRTPDGSAFRVDKSLTTRADFILYHGEIRMGTGFIEPNGNLQLN